MQEENIKIELNLDQEKFCQTYVSEDFYWNWVKSYIEVYKPDQTKKGRYDVACSSASQILSNMKVCQKINQLLERGWLNDNFVDKQLLFLITQHNDKSVKLGAIKEYNTLKTRIQKGLQKAIDDWDVQPQTALLDKLSNLLW